MDTFYLNVETRGGDSTIYVFHTAAPISQDDFILAVEALDDYDGDADIDDLLNSIAERIGSTWVCPICAATLYIE